MLKIFLKIISVLGLSFLSVVLFFSAQFPLIEGKYFLNKYIDTQFAEHYTPEKFEQIKVGMEISEVINLIGQPLLKDKVDKHTNYYYTTDGKVLKEGKGKIIRWYDDFAWYQSMISVSSENIVISVNKGWLHD